MPSPLVVVVEDDLGSRTTAVDDDRVRVESEALQCLAYLRKRCEGHTILGLLRALR